MDMQVYTIHVVPVAIIFYGVFVLFMHPPLKVIGATLAGGLVMTLLNMLGDIVAIHASLWHYSASGLVAQLPLPFYITPLFITGALVYLLIWRFWRSSFHWLSLLFLVGVPVYVFFSNYWQGTSEPAHSFLIWQGQLAWLAELILAPLTFCAGYLVFRALAPARAVENKPTSNTPAIEKQK